VFGISGYADTTAPDARDACLAPARVVAPPGLVDGHPDGTWDLPPGPLFGEQNAIVQQACGKPAFKGPPPCG